MPHRLGFAVKVLGDGGLPSHDTRRWQSGPHLRVSLERLGVIFDYLEKVDVRMYRMASGLVPYGSHPEMEQFHGQVGECETELAALGARARDAGLRLSFHPGQYAVLNSEDEGVRAAAALDVELQASVLEAMGLGPEAVVVLLRIVVTQRGKPVDLDTVKGRSGFAPFPRTSPKMALDERPGLRRSSARAARRPARGAGR